MKWIARISLRGRITLLTGVVILAVSLMLTGASMYNAGEHFNAFYDAVNLTLAEPAGEKEPDPSVEAEPQKTQTSPAGPQAYESVVDTQSEDAVRDLDYSVVPAVLVVKMKQQFNYWSYAYLLLIAGLGMAASWFLAGRALAPVKQLSEAAVKVSGSNLTERIQESSAKDEIGELTCAFNGMMDRLEESFERQKRFSSNVAHELKTPLATMKLSLQMGRMEYESEGVQDGKNSEGSEDAAGIFAVAERSADRLIGVVNDLLVLTSEGTLPMTDEICLPELLRDVVSELQPIYTSKELTVEFDIEEGLCVRGDAGLVSRLFFNLAENAMKYNRPGGTVRIAIHRTPQGICASISDTGQGIGAEEMKHIFEPFYCADISRSRKLGGVGLGLSIAKSAAERHGFEVRAESEKGKGSTFSVIMPPNAEILTGRGEPSAETDIPISAAEA